MQRRVYALVDGPKTLVLSSTLAAEDGITCRSRTCSGLCQPAAAVLLQFAGTTLPLLHPSHCGAGVASRQGLVSELPGLFANRPDWRAAAPN